MQETSQIGTPPTIMHGKFSAYLSWSQPFIHHLVTGISQHARCVALCNRTENLDLFPTPNVECLKTPDIVSPLWAIGAGLLLREHWNPDLLHAHFGWSGIRMVLLKHVLRVPLVTSFGGRDIFVQMNEPGFQELYRVLLEQSDQIISVSEHLREHLLELGIPDEKVLVIHRGANLERFRFVDRQQRGRNAPLKILMVGRLVEKKGHRYAFEAMSNLIKEGFRAEMNVLGEVSTFHELKTLRSELGLASSVTFAGSVSEEEVVRYMQDSDVLVHCSITGEDGDKEGIPNAIVEGAATGLPVIGTSHGGIPEAVRHGETGFLVSERSTDEIYQALKALALDRDLRLKMGEKASQFMHQAFDLRTQVRRHLEIYHELLEINRRDPQALFQTPLPENYADSLTAVFRESSSLSAISVSELFQQLVLSPLGSRRKRPLKVGSEREQSVLEWTYQLRRFVPEKIRWPFKIVLVRFLLYLLARQLQKGSRSPSAPKPDRDAILRQSLESFKSLEDAAFHYLRGGGSLTPIADEWTLGDFEDFLRKEEGIVITGEVLSA